MFTVDPVNFDNATTESKISDPRKERSSSSQGRQLMVFRCRSRSRTCTHQITTTSTTNLFYAVKVAHRNSSSLHLKIFFKFCFVFTPLVFRCFETVFDPFVNQFIDTLILDKFFLTLLTPIASLLWSKYRYLQVFNSL